MGLPVLDGKEEQREQVSSGIVTRSAKGPWRLLGADVLRVLGALKP